MKDPLQFKPTPYDILELNPSEVIDKRVIEESFKKNFNRKGAREARKILNHPVERSLIDIFFYENIYMEKLLPDIYENPRFLIIRREEIALRWIKDQKRYFPYYPMTHILAVFWFWWAVFEEEKVWDENGKINDIIPGLKTGGFSKDDLWKRSIMNWVGVLSNDDYLKNWIQLKRENGSIFDTGELQLLKERIKLFISGYLSTFSEKYRLKGDLEQSGRFREYESLFISELSSAESISGLGYWVEMGGEKHKYCCGRMLLEESGRIDELRDYLERVIKVDSGNIKFQNLRKVLSSYSGIRSLVDQKRYEKALKSIEELPAEERGNREVREIMSDIFFEQGNQSFSTGKTEMALELWKKSLSSLTDSGDRRDTIVQLCSEKAVIMQKTSPEKSIELLEKVRNIFPAKELDRTLSVIYLERGIKKMNDALRMIPGNSAGTTGDEVSDREFNEIISKNISIRDKVLPEVESAVTDMQKAVVLDPESVNAKEQLKIAKNNLADIELLDVYKAVELKKLDYANRRIDNMIKNGSVNQKIKELRTALKSNFCWFCKNRDVPNPVEENGFVEVPMYKETGRDILNVKWNTITFKVPRCKECRMAHENNLSKGFGLGCITGLLVSIGVMVSFKNFNAVYFILVNLVMTLGFGWMDSVLHPEKWKYTANINRKNDYPPVKEKLREGWKLGLKPPDARGTPTVTEGGNND